MNQWEERRPQVLWQLQPRLLLLQVRLKRLAGVSETGSHLHLTWGRNVRLWEYETDVPKNKRPKMRCRFSGKRNTLDVSIVILRGRRNTLDVSCCVLFANRIGRAASSGDSVAFVASCESS